MSTPRTTKASLSAATQLLIGWSVFLLLLLATVASFYFENQPMVYKLVGWLLLLPLLFLLIVQTDKGKQWVEFIKEARIEFFKIVWPSRDEALKSTWVVIALVLIMGFVIWLADNLFMHVVQWLIGQ